LRIGWKEGKSLCENFTRKGIFEFQRMSEWWQFMVFALSLFKGCVASTEDVNFNLIIFKMFWSVSARFWMWTQASVALGVNFFVRNNRFCIMVRYCNIVTPNLKSKISLLRLIAEELWGIRRNFSIFINRFATNVNGCVVHWKSISADKRVLSIVDIINVNSNQSINVW